ncbi:MAG TPA: dephospho-CoA kinase [Tepidisphaeraceae bacterium]|jgi:dephospho-CoA kinase
MFAGKPIIGIVGGIGSGKSFVASVFGELGCMVISSDEQVRQAYRRPEVRQILRQWWGDGVFQPNGEVDRGKIAVRVFADPADRERLERMLHPLVNQARIDLMQQAAKDSRVLAFVWDTPLLVEVGLDRQCDALVFVDAPDDVRYERVAKSRGWNPEEWARREKLQLPLAKKRDLSQDVIRNTAEADDVCSQVRDLLPRILARSR